MDLSKIYIFRMTHVENIPHILEFGITHQKSPNANKLYVPIGDNTLIGTRINFRLQNDKVLGDYIPFYFGMRTPMLYVIQNGFNGVKSYPAEKLIYCVSSIQKVLDSKVNFIYSDGHATDGFTEFFNPSDLNNIEQQVDFKATKAKFWKDENDLDLKRRKEAEFLISEDLDYKYIIGYVVYNQAAKSELLGLGANSKLVHVEPNYYFEI